MKEIAKAKGALRKNSTGEEKSQRSLTSQPKREVGPNSRNSSRKQDGTPLLQPSGLRRQKTPEERNTQTSKRTGEDHPTSDAIELLPHQDKMITMATYIPQVIDQQLLHDMKSLSSQIQKIASSQVPHNLRDIIANEIMRLAKTCDDDHSPYLWDCLGRRSPVSHIEIGGGATCRAVKEALYLGISVHWSMKFCVGVHISCCCCMLAEGGAL